MVREDEEAWWYDMPREGGGEEGGSRARRWVSSTVK